ncbi:MAG: hypothetical protein AAF532_13945 [Planctomycetota bacterium]
MANAQTLRPTDPAVLAFGRVPRPVCPSCLIEMVLTKGGTKKRRGVRYYHCPVPTCEETHAEPIATAGRVRGRVG